MPMTELHSRFRKSELVVMGWRSRETAWNMQKSMERNKARNERPGAPVRSMVAEHEVDALEKRMGGLATKAMTEDGDIDLGKLTGKEALQYFAALGMPMGSRH